MAQCAHAQLLIDNCDRVGESATVNAVNAAARPRPRSPDGCACVIRTEIPR